LMMTFFVNDRLLKLFLVFVSAFIFPRILNGQTTTAPGAPVYRDIKAYDDHITITNDQGDLLKIVMTISKVHLSLLIIIVLRD